MSKVVFLFDGDSGEYTGTYECQESPRETGVFIVPIYSTEEEPPQGETGKVVVWTGDEWGLIDDVRGKWFDALGNVIVVDDIRHDVAGLSKTRTVVQTIPTSVTRRQARRALLQAGLLDQVDAAIDSIQDVIAREEMRIDWHDATEFNRDDQTLNTLAAALNLTNAQLDQLFIEASKF